MIEWVIFGIGLVHVLVFGHLIYRFGKLDAPEKNPTERTFSIIIPTRNEENNLPRLLETLNHLNYPQDKFEIIVVDDSSEDNTRNIVKDFENLPIKVLQLPIGKSGKKAAIELGVSRSVNEIILTTDGDCEVPSGWLSSFSAAFDDEIRMVVGPVRMEYRDFMGALQSFDFSILIGYAASLVGMGVPSMSNGANLAYRREVFSEVGGYNGNSQIPSGDDEFLLLKVVGKYPDGIAFLKDSGAVVSTGSKEKFSDLLNQRVRWLSKWTVHKNPRIILSVLAILIDNLAMLLTIIGLIGGFLPIWLGVILLARLIVKGIFSSQANRLLQGKTNWFAVVIYELIYPFYVVVLSVASIFGNYTWKGRKYSS